MKQENRIYKIISELTEVKVKEVGLNQYLRLRTVEVYLSAGFRVGGARIQMKRKKVF